MDRLFEAKRLLTDSFNFASPSDLLALNQKVQGARAPQPRTVNLHEPYKFPDVDEIGPGFGIINRFMVNSEVHEVVKQAAFTQAMLSLHPFADGNHRTFRLLLDTSLTRAGLPPTTCLKTTDLVFANPVGRKIFSLSDAVQAVLHAMGETIKAADPETLS